MIKLKAEQIFGKNFKIKCSNKTEFITNFLMGYIENKIQKISNEEKVFMPKKEEIANYLKISSSTVQNIYRALEDTGYTQSKQRIGTIIRFPKTKFVCKKQTSKRDCCVTKIKNYIMDNNIKAGESLPSSRQFALIFNNSANTVCAALNYLTETGILEKKNNYILKRRNFTNSYNEKVTLVEKIQKYIESYIEKNCKIGERLPSLKYFSRKLNVSTKTIHDAMKGLEKQQIISIHRGKYGTGVINLPHTEIKTRKEDSIFASAEETSFYFYEKVQDYLKNLIIKNHEIGSKLPSLRQLSEEMKINTNTVRRAMKYLEDDGYIRFTRGRYGGAFVINIPDNSQSFTWLAVNPEYVSSFN